ACCPQEPGACPRHAFQEPATIHPVALVISDVLLFHSKDSLAETGGTDRTRPRLRDEGSVSLMHVAETIARSKLLRRVRSMTSVYVARERLEKVLLNVTGH